MAKKKIKTTKQDIIRCAMTLFLEKGYTVSSMHQIADMLDISTGNLTYYFPTKEHLLAALVDMHCAFQWKRLEEEAADGTGFLLAVCLELLSMASACEQSEIAKDFFLSAYRSQMSLALIRKNDKRRAKEVFREYCPDWSDDQFEGAETLVSGIEYSIFMTTSDSTPLELRITDALNTILTIYQVPKEIRQQKLQKVLALDYRKFGLRTLDEFKTYVDHETEQALTDLLNEKP